MAVPVCFLCFYLLSFIICRVTAAVEKTPNNLQVISSSPSVKTTSLPFLENINTSAAPERGNENSEPASGVRYVKHSSGFHLDLVPSVVETPTFQLSSLLTLEDEEAPSSVEDHRWMVYDKDQNMTMSLETFTHNPSCILIKAKLSILVPVVERGTERNISVDIPQQAVATNNTCHQGNDTSPSQQLLLSWYIPPVEVGHESDDIVSEEVITVYDNNNSRFSAFEAPESLDIDRLVKDPAHDALLSLKFRQMLQDTDGTVWNYVSDVDLGFPLNLTSSQDIINTNGKAIALSSVANKVSYQGSDGAQYRLFRITSHMKNLHIMAVPLLFAFCCDKKIVLSMAASIAEIAEDRTLNPQRVDVIMTGHDPDVDNFNMSPETKGDATYVKVYLVLEHLRLETFRKHRFYNDITHLKWDCIHGWPWVMFYLRYKSRQKLKLAVEGKDNTDDTASDESHRRSDSYHADDERQLVSD